MAPIDGEVDFDDYHRQMLDVLIDVMTKAQGRIEQLLEENEGSVKLSLE